MRRRQMLAWLPVAISTAFGVGGKAHAQEQRAGRPLVIGRLAPISAESDEVNLQALRRGLAQLGWTEGRDYRLETRFAGGDVRRLADLARQLVALPVDLIVTGSHPGALAARAATRTTPIVMVTTGDPVAGGIVASLARPGENVTGITSLGQELSEKRLELLRALSPAIVRVAVLTNPASSAAAAPFLRQRARIAQSLRMDISVHEARTAADLPAAFDQLARLRPQGLLVITDSLYITERAQIVALAQRHRLPAIYGEREFVAAGGLMSYGAPLAEMYQHSATYIDRIAKGARPADLPIEQPTRLELVVNLATASALGMSVPAGVLARADEVIGR